MIYDSTEGRAGEHARAFPGDWQGRLICDDYSDYKALFTPGVIEIGCMARARRRFFEWHASSKSQLTGQALHYIGQFYEIERQVKDLPSDERRRIRQEETGR